MNKNNNVRAEDGKCVWENVQNVFTTVLSPADTVQGRER